MTVIFKDEPYKEDYVDGVIVATYLYDFRAKGYLYRPHVYCLDLLKVTYASNNWQEYLMYIKRTDKFLISFDSMNFKKEAVEKLTKRLNLAIDNRI